MICGPNGGGKTNLLEAIYFGCTARSPRTTNERELVRRGASVTRVTLDTFGEDGGHRVEVGFTPGEAKRIRADGRAVDSLSAAEERPLVAVFLPERLELVKGAPAARRAHLDRLRRRALAGARGDARRPTRGRSPSATRWSPGSRRAWPAAPGSTPGTPSSPGSACGLMADRAEAVEGLAAAVRASMRARSACPATAEIRYRPRSGAETAEGLAAELAERRDADLARGFTAHGPHRDELQLLLEGVPLRAYGSQGQQRTALLALLFAERELLCRAARQGAPDAP